MDPKPTELTVKVEIDRAEPIGGWIGDSAGQRARFDGWLQLISWLQRATGEVEATPSEAGEGAPAGPV